MNSNDLNRIKHETSPRNNKGSLADAANHSNLFSAQMNSLENLEFRELLYQPTK